MNDISIPTSSGKSVPLIEQLEFRSKELSATQGRVRQLETLLAEIVADFVDEDPELPDTYPLTYEFEIGLLRRAVVLLDPENDYTRKLREEANQTAYRGRLAGDRRSDREEAGVTRRSKRVSDQADHSGLR